MKIFRKIILIFIPIFVLACFVVYWIQPKFSLWQMDKSIILKKQELPLLTMFLPARQNNIFLVESGLPQFAFAGPKLTLFNGQYQYKLKIIPSCSNKDLGFMDVTRKNGNLGLGAKEIIAQKQGETQVESLNFEADNASDYEFRLYSKGECSFEIKKIWLERQKVDFRAFFQTVWQKAQSIIK
ncbi:MAG: hypothetical protein M1429_00115 [Patescibacteria group bacterium]|nr:hypothetical protein [Patescibacteria group bacterium]